MSPAEQSNHKLPANDASDDARAEEFVVAIKTFLSGLPPEIQERVRASLLNSFPSYSPRPREYLATILKLVPRGREVTVEEVKKTVEAEGIQATAKGISDALGYLTRKEKATRIGHGRYMLNGVEITTLEEMDAGPPTRNMIDDY
jgi:hypothetical protein